MNSHHSSSTSLSYKTMDPSHTSAFSSQMMEHSMTAVPQRRRSSASSTASLAALASAAMYTQNEIYTFLLGSKELITSADFVCQLLELGGLKDDILLCEFKTIFLDLMAERFSDVWDIGSPKKDAEFRIISHAPSEHHSDPLLNEALVMCNIHPAHISTLLPVSFSLAVNPGLVAYTTSDVEGFQPVHLFEARPYLPPKHHDLVDHSADIRHFVLRSVSQTHAGDFDINSYFDAKPGEPLRRPQLPPL